MTYLIYDKTGKILRVVKCPPAMSKMQAKEGEFVLEGEANDATQKIVDGKIVNKTPEEIEAEKSPVIPFAKRRANITNEQLQLILGRVAKLEKKEEHG